MNLSELSRLQVYLCKVMNDATVNVRPRINQQTEAEVYSGEEYVGLLTKDDDEGDISYDFNIEIDNVAHLEEVQAFLRDRFGSSGINIRPRPNKDDSAEVYAGDEFIAVVFENDDDGVTSYDFNMAILDIDLDEGLGSA